MSTFDRQLAVETLRGRLKFEDRLPVETLSEWSPYEDTCKDGVAVKGSECATFLSVGTLPW